MTEVIAKIAHNSLETPLNISCETPQLLIIENPKEFYNKVSEIKRQFDGENGEYILLCNGKECAFDKVGDFVGDVFSIGVDNKKINFALYKLLEKLSVESEVLLEENRLRENFAHYFYELFDRIDLPLVFDEMTVSDLLKVGKVHIDLISDGCLGKVVDYVNTMVQLKGSKFFVFVNLKSVLSDEELICLYKHCEIEKVGLLIFESGIGRGILEQERFVIISDDLCEIVDK